MTYGDDEEESGRTQRATRARGQTEHLRRANSRRVLEGSADAAEAYPFDAGPFTRLGAALGLSSPASGPAALRRALAAGAAAWVPLLVLSGSRSGAAGSALNESFLLDASAHARYLLAIPLLVAAEPWCRARLALVARQFARAGLVAADERTRLDALLESARRRLEHRGAAVLLVAGAFATTFAANGVLYPHGVPGWAASGAGAGMSPAGWWRVMVSQPFFLLLAGAWLWRAAVWTCFLRAVSRLRLRLVPAHPDRAAGLHFVAGSLGAFTPVALALGTVAAGTAAEEMLPGARSPLAHGAAATLALALLAFAGPLLVFVGPLRRARLRGAAEYGALACALGRGFEERWLGRRLERDALAAPDFSAAADLYSIVANVRQMSLVPFGLWDLAPLAAATLLPFVPLVLLAVPLDELVGRLAQLFL